LCHHVAAAAADILSADAVEGETGRDGDAGDKDAKVLGEPARRNGVDDVVGHRLLPRRILNVHDGRFAGDGHGLFHRPDPHVRVHRGRERSGQLDALALDDAEAAQSERYRVGAGAQVDDSVTTVPSVTTERVFSISAGLDVSTVTPGSTAPDVSLTTPAIDACAKRTDARRSSTRTNDRTNPINLHLQSVIASCQRGIEGHFQRRCHGHKPSFDAVKAERDIHSEMDMIAP
jgi:hypothetical protein